MSKFDTLEDWEYRRDEWNYREAEERDRTEHPEEFCELCGAPMPCSKRACMDALQAQADYAEGTIWPSDWSKR